MGNPSTETAATPAGNDHAAAAINLLSLLDQVVTIEQQRGLIDSAGVRAQLAVVHELNTIARILAHTAEIFVPVRCEEADATPIYQQHNAIVERLGL